MNRYEKILKKLERKISKLIRSMLSAGATEQQIIKAVKELIASFNPYKQLSEQFLKDAEIIGEKVFKEVSEQLQLLTTITRPKLSAKAFKTIVVANNQFALMQTTINKRVVETVKTALKKGWKFSQLSEELQKAVGGGRYRADTIANTSLQGFSAANRVDLERQAGVKKWKYVGPPPNRSFCSEHIGKSYTYKEISNMSNGQGLPVFYYGGGWNCPHIWQAVITPDLLKKSKK